VGAGKNGSALLEEIEDGIEDAVRRLLKKGDLTVADLLKVRDVVREILAERPREIEVRWVNSCEGTKDTEESDSKET
jgi:hypothetical protein